MLWLEGEDGALVPFRVGRELPPISFGALDKAYRHYLRYGGDANPRIVASPGVVAAYKELLAADERYYTRETPGFASLTYKGMPIVFSRECLDNRLYFVNREGWRTSYEIGWEER